VPAPQKARETQPPGLYLKELQSDIKRNPAGEAFLSVPDKTLLLAIEHINKVISGIDVELHHEIHEASNSIIVTLIDKDTRDVILQIPPESLLNAFIERMVLNGIYIDELR
jgi:flagellar protein FlaG